MGDTKQLPVPPTVRPMLAKAAHKLPDGGGDRWLYEPKWDGFRTIVFRDGDDLLLQSRDLKPMNRYFPELEAPLKAQLPPRCVVDGELVIVTPGGLDFDALQQRIHPAASRVAMLADKTPAAFVAFDLLCLGDDDLTAVPFAERRKRLEQALGQVTSPVHLTPTTGDREAAADWFARFEGAGLDGVMAKRPADVYEPGKRTMLKIKHKRTADCVVAGFRWHKGGAGTRIGSLLLGLYDAEGRLNHVGVAASFTQKRREELVGELQPLRDGVDESHPWHDWISMGGAGDAEAAGGEGGHRVPGAKSRWNQNKDLSWEPLRAERVVEVSYDHMQGTRFRHTAHFVRWRDDKPPRECTYEQLEVTPPYELQKIFSGAAAG